MLLARRCSKIVCDFFRYGKKIPKVPDPVISNFAPDVHFGSVSENIEKMLKNYFEEVYVSIVTVFFVVDHSC